MLAEERHAIILKILEEKKAVTVLDLVQTLNTSESTVRRDLTILHSRGLLYKVYGGATSIANNYSTGEADMDAKRTLSLNEKKLIAQKAASLISDKDFIYLDAGTTTLLMIDYLQTKKATYVTNGIAHAARLSARGFRSYILGGELKASTEAVIGIEAADNLRRYNFTKGFFGTNGISIKSGFSTPDPAEGQIKSEAIAHCKKSYILADSSKFNKIFPISFANISCAAILTDQLIDKKYREYTSIIEVNKTT
jgi:DeoR family fructose operon transcriptional repressor